VLEPTDSFFYKHQASDHTPVGEELLSSTRVVKDGRRGTELSNLEVHTVSTRLILPRPVVSGVLVLGRYALRFWDCDGARRAEVNIANLWIRCFGDKGDVEDITEGQ
jgi:hypothetical protein